MSKGLEALKTIRYIHDTECGKDESINKDFDTIEKELKVLEIIRYKRVEVKEFIVNNITLERYNYLYSWKSLNQEEYNLLKEVLVCH